MEMNFISGILYLLKLTITREVLWEVLPLFVATIVMLIYSRKYKEEKSGWGSNVANSLVLLFVSMSLLRYIYKISVNGAGNYIDFPGKTIAVILLLLIGLIVLRFNFEHTLPKRIAETISSSLTVNLSAYAIILYIHSEKIIGWMLLLQVFVIFILAVLITILLKKPVDKLFNILQKMKELEKEQEVKQEKFEIDELKEQLKIKEKIKKIKVKNFEKQKKEALKLKKIVKS